MRTTIFIKPHMAKLLKPLAASKKLSAFIHQCLEEHYAAEAKRNMDTQLGEAYARANEEGQPVSKEFAVAETEDWPAW